MYWVYTEVIEDASGFHGVLQGFKLLQPQQDQKDQLPHAAGHRKRGYHSDVSWAAASSLSTQIMVT